jgi:hypothetical protein
MNIWINEQTEKESYVERRYFLWLKSYQDKKVAEVYFLDEEA